MCNFKLWCLGSLILQIPTYMNYVKYGLSCLLFSLVCEMALFQAVLLFKIANKMLLGPNPVYVGLSELSKSAIAGEGEEEPCKTKSLNYFIYETLNVLLLFCSVTDDWFILSCNEIL